MSSHVSRRAAERLLKGSLVSGDGNGDPFEMSCYLEEFLTFMYFDLKRNFVDFAYQRRHSVPVSPYPTPELID